MDTPVDPAAPQGWPLIEQPSPSGEQDPPAPGRTDRAGADRSRSLRASDHDRALVATVLSTAYAEGRLTHEEHDERLDEAMRARTFDELVPLTEDLVPLDPGSLPPGPAVGGSAAGTPAAGGAAGHGRPIVDRSQAAGESDRFVAVLGSFDRTGPWRVRPRNQMLTLFGSGTLDLTEAVWESDHIEVLGLTVFGSVEVTVPPGVTVHNQTMAVLGGADADVPRAPDASPTLVLKGLCLFGSVSVRAGRPAGQGRRREVPGRSEGPHQ